MSDIKSTFFNITKNLSKTSGELVKTTKLNMELAGEEDNLKNIYVEIGKKVHEIYTYGGSLGKVFDEKYAELVEAQNKVDALKKQIDTIKGVRECPKCGRNTERNAEFCPSCGFGLEARDQSVQISEPGVENNSLNTEKEQSAVFQKQEEPIQKQVKKCSACGAENESGNRFCLSCGRVL